MNDSYLLSNMEQNNLQIAFIICCDNELYYSESLRYISELEIPEGFDIDVLCVADANSVAVAYNEAMNASAAKYKVYLQQGVLILNRHFLYDVIRIFQNNSNIGMLGICGTEKLNEAVGKQGKWEVGKAAVYNGRELLENCYNQENDEEYVPVHTVDNSLIVTQYDIPWREDLSEMNSFYNVSQSLEMLRRGLSVVVPYQEKPWCYCDMRIHNMHPTNESINLLISEYRDFFELIEYEEEKTTSEELVSIKDILIELVKIHDYEKLLELTDELKMMNLMDVDIIEIIHLMEIYRLEEDNECYEHSEWFLLQDWKLIFEYYQWLRFVLLRMNYGREDERIEELRLLIKEKRITSDAIRKFASCSFNINNGIDSYVNIFEKKKEQPLVSVVVPVYNGEKFIKRTIDSILNQTYENLEVIVVDDCSTDMSRRIIESYQDSRIKKIFLESNRNICNSGNVGFENASGKYIALIGHDDIWLPEKLEKQVHFLEEHPKYAVCFTWADIVNENQENRNKKYDGLYRLFNSENYSQIQWNKKLFQSTNSFCAPSACIRKESLLEVGYYRYALVQLQDYELWMRMVARWPVYILQEKLTLYSRFDEEGKNLSSISMATMNRDFHETQWIKESYLRNLSITQFVTYFGNVMKNSKVITEKEILIEKTFLLWAVGNCFAEKWFIEILEDRECREILEKEYSFGLQDFYKLNTQAMLFDMEMLRKAEYWEKKYKELINDKV